MARLVWTVMLFAGCASSPGPQMETENVTVQLDRESAVSLTRDRTTHSSHFPASGDAILAAVAQVHEKLGIPLESEDRAQGRATYVVRERARTLAARSMSSLIDCGQTNTGPRADSYRVTVRIDHSVRTDSINVGATLNTVVEATARNPGLSSAAVSCRSRGTLEQLISDHVRALLPKD